MKLLFIGQITNWIHIFIDKREHLDMDNMDDYILALKI